MLALDAASAENDDDQSVSMIFFVDIVLFRSGRLPVYYFSGEEGAKRIVYSLNFTAMSSGSSRRE
jgi:hypothetical protein